MFKVLAPDRPDPGTNGSFFEVLQFSSVASLFRTDGRSTGGAASGWQRNSAGILSLSWSSGLAMLERS